MELHITDEHQAFVIDKSASEALWIVNFKSSDGVGLGDYATIVLYIYGI